MFTGKQLVRLREEEFGECVYGRQYNLVVVKPWSLIRHVLYSLPYLRSNLAVLNVAPKTGCDFLRKAVNKTVMSNDCWCQLAHGRNINQSHGYWPVDGGLLGIDGLCEVQAVVAVIVNICGDFPQLHTIHSSRHSGSQQNERRRSLMPISGFGVYKTVMRFFFNLK